MDNPIKMEQSLNSIIGPLFSEDFHFCSISLTQSIVSSIPNCRVLINSDNLEKQDGVNFGLLQVNSLQVVGA